MGMYGHLRVYCYIVHDSYHCLPGAHCSPLKTCCRFRVPRSMSDCSKSDGLTAARIGSPPPPHLLLSLTRIGLRRLLDGLGNYCMEEKLTINYTKPKVLVFRKRTQKLFWSILGIPTEQCEIYKYLSLICSHALNCNAQAAAIKSSAIKIIGPILRFLNSSQTLCQKCYLPPTKWHGTLGMAGTNTHQAGGNSTSFTRCLLALPNGRQQLYGRKNLASL